MSSDNVRDFVSSHWPNPDTPGGQVRSMYERIAAAEFAKSLPVNGTSTSINEQTNGKMHGQANGQVNGKTTDTAVETDEQ